MIKYLLTEADGEQARLYAHRASTVIGEGAHNGGNNWIFLDGHAKWGRNNDFARHNPPSVYWLAG